MATQDQLRSRLRCLLDDNGHGYSQSAPSFVTDLSGLADPRLDIQIDDDLAPQTISLGPPADLTTGQAIARALQDAIRAAAPDPENDGYTNASVRYHREEGYVIMSGTKGNESRVTILTASAGDDAAAPLKLGQPNGGMETPPASKFSDEELDEMLDAAVAYQNSVDLTAWNYDTIPPGYETVVSYRSWGYAIDCLMGRAANYFPQKVASEETSANVIFDNYFKLRKWLKDVLDDLLEEIGGGIHVSNVIRYDRLWGGYVGDRVYDGQGNYTQINAVLEGETNTEVILEFQEMLTQDVKKIYIAYRQGASPVFDQTILTEEDFEDPGRDDPACLATGSVLARELESDKNTLVKITGLTAGETYYFQMQMVDHNDNRHFSNEVSLELSP